LKLLTCPLNGPRPVTEFVCGAELRESPDPQTCSDAQWTDYIFNRNGAPGVKREWWCHIASGYWFVVERDTLRDEVLATFAPERLREAARR
jgi:sarcosine oxidase subunit delta